MSVTELTSYELDGEESYYTDSDEEPPAPKETAFQKEIKKQIKQLGRNLGHNAFYYKYSEAAKFINLKKRDPEAKLYFPGSYVWIANKRELYEPAKVIKRITYSKVALKAKKKALKKGHVPKTGNVRELILNSSSQKVDEEKEEVLGQVVVQAENELVILNVNAKAAKHLLPMRSNHLTPRNVLDVNIDDLSSASIMYNLRYQFENKDESCLQIGDKTLVYCNRFLSREDEMMRGIEKTMARRNGEIEDDEPPLNIATFAERIFQNLNRKRGMEPQSCIISGNKFSNRRNVTKDFTTKIIQLSQANDATWYEKLQAADEILTVFGGENFLRWTELHMKYNLDDDEEEERETQKGKLIGAAFQSFLLDTSNVINKDAKSFNIFHQICVAAKRSAKRKAEEKKAAEVQAKSDEQKPKTWKEKQEAQKQANNKIDIDLKPRKASRVRKTPDEIDFVEELDDIFKVNEEKSYFYLNKGILPQYRFTPEEVKDYFEDPEVKRKRLEAERKAREEAARIEEEKRREAERQVALAKAKAEEEAEAKRRKVENVKKRKREQAQIAKRLNINTIGKGSKNKYLENLRKNKENKSPKKISIQEEFKNTGKGFANAKGFFETKKENKSSTSVNSRRNSGKSQAQIAQETIALASQEHAEAILKDKEEKGTTQSAGEETNEQPTTTGETAEEPKQEEKNEADEAQEVVDEEEEDEEDIDELLVWERTLENLRTLNVRNSEIAGMITVLRDILEIGNILVCNTKRTDGKKKHAEIVDTISDDEKDEELVEKKISVHDIYNTKKHKTLKKVKLDLVQEPDDGKQVIDNVAINFLIEKKLVKKTVFGVKLKDLVTVLNVRKLKIGNEEFLKPVGKNNSLARRDALVRALYAGMFNWLLSTINRGVSFTQEEAKRKGEKNMLSQIGIVGILEAVGLVTELDKLNSNGLDQLINNYAMEKLHSFQTIHLLEEHATVYKNYGLTVPFTEGNELVLPLILGQTKNLDEGVKLKNKKVNKRSSFTRTFAAMNSKVRENTVALPQNKYQRNKKTLGILDICEEQFREPKGNDKKLIERIMKDHKRHQNMLISKSRYAFKIQHFGAKVSYHVKGFVKRLWSSVLDEEVKEFMINNTKDKLVKKLLQDHSISKQQKKLDQIYKSGMKQIKLGLAVERIELENELAQQQGPLIFSPHTVNINNSRLKRDTTIMTTPSKEAAKKERRTRMSVSRGLTGMTMTLNLAGITRARNANGASFKSVDTKQQPSIVSVPVSGSKVQQRAMKFNGSANKKTEAKANSTEGVRTVFNTMKTLIVMLDLTEPHFIHCIPTNQEHENNSLDVLYAYEQLKIAGIIPFFGFRFKESSFGTGMTFEELKRKFLPLSFLVRPENRENASMFMKNVQELGAIPRDSWKIGQDGDRVFLKLGSLSDIETLSDTSFKDIIVYIQKYWRMCLTRKLYFVLLEEKFERLIDKGCAENNLSALTTVVGKSNFFQIKPKNLYLANGKIKRLRKELKLRKRLEAVTKNGTITEIYGVLNEAKDEHLPRCPEFIAAIDRYKKLDYEANVVAITARKQLKKTFLPVLDEMQEVQQEDAEWENGGAEAFALEIERMMKEQETANEDAVEDEPKQTKLDAFFEMQQSKKERDSAQRHAQTVRFGEMKDAAPDGMLQSFTNLDLIDRESVDFDVDEEYDDAHHGLYASPRTSSQNGSIVSNMTSDTNDMGLGGLFSEDIGNSGSLGMLQMEDFNKMVKGNQGGSAVFDEGAPQRSSSIFKMFSSRKGGNRSKATKRGFSFARFFGRGKAKKNKGKDDENSDEKTSDEENIRNILTEATQNENQREREESWDLSSNDSLQRVDHKQPPESRVNSAVVKPNLFKRIRSSVFQGSSNRNLNKS